eukprot:1380521-Amphidinium_carterae.1
MATTYAALGEADNLDKLEAVIGLRFQSDPRHAWLVTAALSRTPGLKLSNEEYKAGTRLSVEQTAVYRPSNRVMAARRDELGHGRTNQCTRGIGSATWQ